MPDSTRPSPRIVRVWIGRDCLIHDLCESTCPQVFKTTDDIAVGTLIVPGAERYFDSHRVQIEEAAEGCPMDVIRIQYDDGTIK